MWKGNKYPHICNTHTLSLIPTNISPHPPSDIIIDDVFHNIQVSKFCTVIIPVPIKYTHCYQPTPSCLPAYHICTHMWEDICFLLFVIYWINRIQFHPIIENCRMYHIQSQTQANPNKYMYVFYTLNNQKSICLLDIDTVWMR